MRLSHFAEVTGVYHVHQLMSALLLGHLHLWSDETVEKRFAYRTPGLHVLTVRVHKIPTPHEIADTPHYQGCRSWVELDEPLSTEGAVPVLSDKDYHDVQNALDLLLNPTAYA